MPLDLVRIDCRLIHGQVLEAWVPYVKSECILVADDDVAENDLQRTIMSMSVPSGIEVVIDTVESATLRFRNNEWNAKGVLLLFGNCRNALLAHSLGLRYTELNVGNIHYAGGRRQVTPSVALDTGDFDRLQELHDRGVNIELRAIPHEKPILLSQLASSS